MLSVNDFKYAIRLLLKKPGFTLLTMLVMATGVALSLFLFSFFYTTSSKPLPFDDSESMIIFNSFQKGISDYGREINIHDYYEIRTGLKGVSEFGAYANMTANVAGNDGARRYSAILAEPNLFQITRTQPILGRVFTQAENQIGANRVVVIGFDVWKNQYGSSSEILEQSMRINGANHQIIGVMPQGYVFPHRAQLWLPIQQDATKLARGKSGSAYGIAHLKDGTSMDDVNQQLEVIMQRLEKKYPETNNGVGAYISTLQYGQGTREGYLVIYSMYTMAVLILLLASINVGNLLLSRAIERGKETAIRVALGAPRKRLISLLLWESVIICFIGGLIGLLITAWGLEILNAVVANFWVDKPVFWWKFGLDSYTVKLFFLFFFFSVIFTGFLPAWKNSGEDFNQVLRDGTRGALGKKEGRLNKYLVTSEIFLSMTIMIAASVVILSSYIASLANYGSNPEGLLTAKVILSQSGYKNDEEKTQFVNTFRSYLEQKPGITDVMIATKLPGMIAVKSNVAIKGEEYIKNLGYPRANYIQVLPGSLAKLGVELKLGRYFSNIDNGIKKSTAIVTDSFSDRYFPNKSPIGERIRIVNKDNNDVQWLTIVGIVEHTIQGGSGEDVGNIPSIFRPYSQNPSERISVAIRSNLDNHNVVKILRQTLKAIDPELPAFNIEPYNELIARNIAAQKFISTIFLLFGIAAVVLASSGIYGVMSNMINQKTQEIGVKRALGAREQQIIKDFILSGGKLLLLGGIPGMICGCAMGFALSKVFGSINGALPIIALIMFSIVGGVVMFATYLPTKRALELEPSAALHYE